MTQCNYSLFLAHITVQCGFSHQMAFHEVIQGPKILLSMVIPADEVTDYFLLNLISREVTNHFHSHSIVKNSVLWPYLSARVSGKYTKCKCPRRKEMSFGEHIAVSAIVQHSGHQLPTSFFLYTYLFPKGDSSESHPVTASGWESRISEIHNPFLSGLEEASHGPTLYEKPSVHFPPPEDLAPPSKKFSILLHKYT